MENTEELTNLCCISNQYGNEEFYVVMCVWTSQFIMENTEELTNLCYISNQYEMKSFML